MSDQLHLSYWIRGFAANNLMAHFEKLLGAFPLSRLDNGIQALTIYAIEFAEPPLVEHAFPETPEIGDVLQLAREFGNPDCAYQVEAAWDLLQFEDDWKLAPSPVSLICYGPQFENELGDNLRLELGPDSLFVPEPEIPGSPVPIQANIKSLLRLVHDLDQAFPVNRRRLWTESGENFAERLQAAAGM
jgi:hypothetical protein